MSRGQWRRITYIEWRDLGGFANKALWRWRPSSREAWRFFIRLEE